MKWLLFPVFLISFASSGQRHSAEKDTIRVNELLRQSKNYQWTSPGQSLNYADEALLLATKSHYQKGVALAHTLKGFCFWAFGDNELAIASAMEALEISQREKLRSIESESYGVLARGYMDVRETTKAKEAIVKAEMLALGGNNWEQLCSIYNLKGVILFISDKTDSALNLYTQALEIGRTHAVDSIHFPRIISNIGECYAPENPSLALEYYTKALEMARRTGNKITEASIAAIVGEAYLQRSELKKAEHHLQTSLQLARTLGLRRVVRHAYGGLVDLKLQQGNGDEAVVYLRRYYQVRDSLLNSAKVRQIVEMEAKHEIQLKEQHIKILESEKELQTLWKNLLIGLVLLLILFSIGFYLLQQYRHRKNHEVLNLEIDYLTRQYKETKDKFKATLVQDATEELESHDQKILKKAILLVEVNITDPLFGVEKMASEMNMSRASLHRKIKSITGFPPSELIRSIRLRKAAKLILGRVDSVSQIAMLVGFTDYSHFSKSFKKHFGVAPTSYEERAHQPVEV